MTDEANLPSYNEQTEIPAFPTSPNDDDDKALLAFPTPIAIPQAQPQSSQQPSGFSAYYAPSPPNFSLTAALITPNHSTNPLSFTRTPNPNGTGHDAAAAPFRPMYLLAASEKSTSLSKGFNQTPPPSSENGPHPFVTHDVNEIDWISFLNDVHAAGALTDKDLKRSHIPIVSRIPFIGRLSTYGVQKYMKSRKAATVAKRCDTWNHHFFEPRKMRVVLMRGKQHLNGPPPDTAVLEMELLYNLNNGGTVNSPTPGTGKKHKGKGKHKESGPDDSEVYRLFVLPA